MTTSGEPPAGDPTPPAPTGQPPSEPFAQPYGAPEPAEPPGQQPFGAQPFGQQPTVHEPYGRQPGSPEPYAAGPVVPGDHGYPAQPPAALPPAGYPVPQPPMGYGPPPGALPPDNYLVWAILSTIMCCLPLGIASIVFSAQVNDKWARGDVAGAMESARKAKQFATWSAVAYFVVAAVVIILYVGFFAVMIGTGVATSP